MLSTRFLGKLGSEDLARWQAINSRRLGLEENPTAYSANETETIILANFRFRGEISERFEVDDTREWVISPYTGTIYYEEDD